jgi:hypothetical protein
MKKVIKQNTEFDIHFSVTDLPLKTTFQENIYSAIVQLYGVHLPNDTLSITFKNTVFSLIP